MFHLMRTIKNILSYIRFLLIIIIIYEVDYFNLL